MSWDGGMQVCVCVVWMEEVSGDQRTGTGIERMSQFYPWDGVSGDVSVC